MNRTGYVHYYIIMNHNVDHRKNSQAIYCLHSIWHAFCIMVRLVEQMGYMCKKCELATLNLTALKHRVNWIILSFALWHQRTWYFQNTLKSFMFKSNWHNFKTGILFILSLFVHSPQIYQQQENMKILMRFLHVKYS